MAGGGTVEPKVPDPSPIPIEVDARKAQSDVRKRLKNASGRQASVASGFLSTPPQVTDLALEDTLSVPGDRLG